MWRFVYMFMIMSLCLLPFKAEASVYSERIASLAEIKAVRIASEADHVRLVVDVTKPVEYRTLFLSNPDRIVVDIKGAWLGKEVSRERIVSSQFVSKVRIGQNDPQTVRIVVESEVGRERFNVFPLSGGAAGYRVVMDFGKPAKAGGSTSSAPQQSSAPEIKEPEKPTDEQNDNNGTEINPADPEKNVGPEKKEETENPEEEELKEEPPVNKKKIKGLKKKLIVIDPGHGGEDSGAIGPSGVMEKNITLRIAQQLEALLDDVDAKVIMTRQTDTEVSPKHRQATDIEELQARCDVANKAGADMFISIHMDSFTSGTAKGTTGYYYAKGTVASKRLAVAVQKNLVNRLGTTSRGVKTCNFYVVKHTNMPATLIEVAFVSNTAEEKLLTSDAGVKKAARGIFDGIVEFFNQ